MANPLSVSNTNQESLDLIKKALAGSKQALEDLIK